MTAQPSRISRVKSKTDEKETRNRGRSSNSQELIAGMRISHPENGKATIIHMSPDGDSADVLWDDPKSLYSLFAYIKLDNVEILNEPRRTMVRLDGIRPQALAPRPKTDDKNRGKGKGKPRNDKKRNGNGPKPDKPVEAKDVKAGDNATESAKPKKKRRRKPRNKQGQNASKPEAKPETPAAVEAPAAEDRAAKAPQTAVDTSVEATDS